MGGMQCFGPVLPEPDEPVFHAEWEKRALALTVAMGATGAWNIDMSRFARERIAPAKYLALSYYQIWLAGLETLLVERGLATAGEAASGKSAGAGRGNLRVPDARSMAAILAKGAPADRPAGAPAMFRIGQAVRARNINPQGHTRLPRYARGHNGVIEAVVGCHVFPDRHARDGADDPQWLYTVRFSARELFGGPDDHRVHVDCWEPYLAAA
jgi:nitrile hydratase